MKFAKAMNALQSKISLSPELVQLIVIAHQLSNETVEMLTDCANNLIDIDQLVAFVIGVTRRANN